MPVLPKSTTDLNARWDGRRVLFEVTDRGHPVTCAISMNALQDMSARRRFKPAELLECFVAASGRIEAIALAKAQARSPGASSVLNIWSDDIDEAPPLVAPVGREKAKPLPVA